MVGRHEGSNRRNGAVGVIYSVVLEIMRRACVQWVRRSMQQLRKGDGINEQWETKYTGSYGVATAKDHGGTCKENADANYTRCSFGFSHFACFAIKKNECWRVIAIYVASKHRHR